MGEVFRALADPSRRRLLDRLNDRNEQTLRELRREGLSRQSVRAVARCPGRAVSS